MLSPFSVFCLLFFFSFPSFDLLSFPSRGIAVNTTCARYLNTERAGTTLEEERCKIVRREEKKETSQLRLHLKCTFFFSSCSAVVYVKYRDRAKEH